MNELPDLDENGECVPAPIGHRTLDSHLKGYDPIAEVLTGKALGAWTDLQAIGCPLLHPGLEWGGVFAISSECNGDRSHGGIYWADHNHESVRERYEDPDDKESRILNRFGVAQRVHDILDRYSLYTEWCNAGVLSVYEL